MGRIVCIRTIRKVRKAEISKFEAMTRREIMLDYENVMALFEGEYSSDRYASLRKHMTKIKTADGNDFYIAHTKILSICSDELLAKCIEGRIRNYANSTYRDITKLAGEKLSGSSVRTVRTGYGPDDVKTVERNMNFQLPKKERGVYIFFFDDMD